MTLLNKVLATIAAQAPIANVLHVTHLPGGAILAVVADVGNPGYLKTALLEIADQHNMRADMLYSTTTAVFVILFSKR